MEDSEKLVELTVDWRGLNVASNNWQKQRKRNISTVVVMGRSYKVHIQTSTSPSLQHQAKFARPTQSIQQPKFQYDFKQNHSSTRFSQPYQRPRLQQVSLAKPTPTSPSKSPQPSKLRMDSPQNPTATNRSQPPQQPKIQMDSSQNPTAANCSQLSQQPKV